MTAFAKNRLELIDELVTIASLPTHFFFNPAIPEILQAREIS